MMRKLSLIILYLLIGCNSNYLKPMGYIFNQMPKGGSPIYEQAWKDGCTSGLATQYGNAFYKTFYTWKKDIKLMNNSLYKNVFWNAHTYCHHYVVATLIGGNMASQNMGEKLPTLGNHSVLENVYALKGGRDAGFLAFW